MDAQTTSAIAVDRLVKRYKGVAAVDGISFRLATGSITGLLGGNGAGKTTTIAMIMGLVTPTAGSVTVLGATMPKERYRVLHRMNFESPYVDMPMRLTVRQNLSVFAQLYAVADIGARIAELAADLELDRISRPADRQAFGRAEDPRVARQGFAQQAGSAAARRADGVARSRHRRLGARPARALSREQGATVLLASHNMSEVERLCERVIIMKQGRIEDDDTPEQLLTRYGRANAGGRLPRRRARARRPPRGGAMNTLSSSRPSERQSSAKPGT